MSAGALSGAGAASTPEGVAAYHRKVAAAGSTPMDDPPAEPSAGDLVEALRLGLEKAEALGLVGITEAGMSDWRHWDALVELRRRGGGRLPVAVRVFVASGAADLERMAAARSDSDEQLAVIGVKFYADGWLGPRTCACSAPFADVAADDHGVLFMDAETLARRAGPYVDAGWRVATHAIGDRAIEVVLDAYGTVYGGATGCRRAGARIEHAQVLRSDLIARMESLGVTACIQPCFATSDAEPIAAALAGRFPDAYRWDRLIDAGVRVVAGSDFPIETLDPAIGLDRLTSGDHPLDEVTALRLMTAPLEPPSIEVLSRD